jgi:hypothetical protein
MASLGAVIAMIVLSIGGLVLVVLGAMMMIGAVMPKRSVITSWPMQQEQSFTSFDQRTQSSQSSAWTIAIVSSLAVFVILVGITLGVSPEKTDLGKSMNMSNLTKKEGTAKPAPAPAPKAETPPAPAPEAPAPAPEAPKQ